MKKALLIVTVLLQGVVISVTVSEISLANCTAAESGAKRSVAWLETGDRNYEVETSCTKLN